MMNCRPSNTKNALPLFALFAALITFAGPAAASDLDVWEATSLPGVPRLIVSPATDAAIDVDYSPSSAEGGGIYGMSEVEIAVTGDLTINATGFSCQAFGCLWSPFPFTAGRSVIVSGADNLTGEFTSNQDLLELTISGSLGHVVVVTGRYLDAAGIAQSIGNIQDIDVAVLATVPEPNLGLTLGMGAALLSTLKRARRRS